MRRWVGHTGKWSWVSPVLEANDLATWSATCREDDTEQDQTDDGNDLDGSEPEFTFTIDTSTHKVDEDDDDKADCDPDAVVDAIVP